MRRETSEVISRFLLYGLAIEVSKISWVLGTRARRPRAVNEPYKDVCVFVTSVDAVLGAAP